METESNFEQLKNKLKEIGFDDYLDSEIHRLLLSEEKNPSIVVDQRIFNLNRMYDVNLRFNFKRSETSSAYFLSRYSVKQIDVRDGDKAQTFYISKSNNIAIAEAINLLNGRSVNKNLVMVTGEKYNAWLRLNFLERDKSNNYKVVVRKSAGDYDLDSILKKLHIQHIEDKDFLAKLSISLRAGNAEQILLTRNGKEELMYVAAKPETSTLAFFDRNGFRVTLDKKDRRKDSELKLGQRRPKGKTR